MEFRGESHDLRLKTNTMSRQSKACSQNPPLFRKSSVLMGWKSGPIWGDGKPAVKVSFENPAPNLLLFFWGDDLKRSQTLK